MAVTKGSYYTGEGPEIPSAGNDYDGHPTPHSAVANQTPFEAPSGNLEPSNGFAATDNPKVTRAPQMSTQGADNAQAAFDAGASYPQ